MRWLCWARWCCGWWCWCWCCWLTKLSVCRMPNSYNTSHNLSCTWPFLLFINSGSGFSPIPFRSSVAPLLSTWTWTGQMSWTMRRWLHTVMMVRVRTIGNYLSQQCHAILIKTKEWDSELTMEWAPYFSVCKQRRKILLGWYGTG